ncbi:MAG: hypothetical protein QNK18_01845 [Gammaproteobacteria bacterium]|nr:hypothetical protein [Gammaproteobacteria bacterium]MDJ0889926.1 hypothetical protein [Gammaproteobacteria bacterium]
MSTFDPKSRYVRNASTYEATDRRGRVVQALTPATAPVQTELGEHILKQGQRLDHLAQFYLKDPNGFWKIAEHNNAMLPDALLQQRTVKIPSPSS